MADYFTPTVIEPPLPLADITPLERLVLKAVFQTEDLETEENRRPALYCYASESVNDFLSLDAAEVFDALGQSENIPSRLHDLVTKELPETTPDADTLELDLSVEGYEFILQDIVRRSTTLSHITVEAAFTCSKMRPDGFGGMAMLVTKDAIISESTNGLLEKWRADAFP